MRPRAPSLDRRAEGALCRPIGHPRAGQRRRRLSGRLYANARDPARPRPHYERFGLGCGAAADLTRGGGDEPLRVRVLTRPERVRPDAAGIRCRPLGRYPRRVAAGGQNNDDACGTDEPWARAADGVPATGTCGHGRAPTPSQRRWAPGGGRPPRAYGILSSRPAARALTRRRKVSHGARAGPSRPRPCNVR